MYDFFDVESSAIIKIAEGVAKTFGKRCEVVVHNLSKPESSVVFVAGNLTNRTIGAPATNVLIQLLRVYGDNAPDAINYESQTMDGKRLKSSTIFIRDPKTKKILGCVCINYDLSEWDAFSAVLEDFTNVSNNRREKFPTTVMEILSNLIEDAVKTCGKAPIAMNREEKLQFIKMLDEQGAFLIKGAIDVLASRLGMSRQSIYMYHDEIRKQNKSKEY